MVRVLGRVTSINVRKVLWALDELGESYDRADWGLPIRDPKVPEFLALNPNAQIPVFIDDDGLTLWESNAILLYLAKTRSALLPVDIHAHGRALQWLIWQATELNPAWGYAHHALARKTPGYDDPAKIAESVSRWNGQMDILDAELAKGAPFIAGEDFSIADIALGLSTHRWLRTPFERKALPHVEAHYERLRQRPAGAKWMPDNIP
ncbi:glutathione S-transferase family protein [Devosia sp. Leaf64]|uniref:glutathione S-transferase family protein n=1 Tax=Devosia sp. Leaf64 TaxID=1736229 RepID=UPI000715D157|nr:glutathione S-transferase family protein [Devosia sp. Leaf64]KQN75124.1 glutathione S-transferase [Devosia sp. Leaf64]